MLLVVNFYGVAQSLPCRAKLYSDREKLENREDRVGWAQFVLWVRDYDAWMNRVSKVLLITCPFIVSSLIRAQALDMGP